MRFVALAAVILASAAAQAAPAAPATAAPAGEARRTIAIVPFVSSAAAEYRWIGAGVAHALVSQLLEVKELNTLTTRQLNAAVRNDNLNPEQLNDDKNIDHLAVQTGADFCVMGSYTAEWPEVTIIARLYNAQTKKTEKSFFASGNVEEFFSLEAQIAKGIGEVLNVKIDTSTGPIGTKNLYAFHQAISGFDLLNWQSMSPRAQLTLPAGSVKKARLHFEKAAKLDPKYADAYAGLGMAQAFSGEPDNARKSFGQSTQLAIGGFEPQAVLGKYYTDLHSGRTDDALKGLDASQKARPGFLHAVGYLGETYNHMGRYREALATFERYHKLSPKQPWVMVQIGYTKSKLKRFDEAISDTKTAVAMLPDSVSFQTELASRYIDADKLTDAEQVLQKSLEKYPKNAKVYLRLGYVYLLQSKTDQAIPVLQRALQEAQLAEENRVRSYAHFDLARAFAIKKNNKDALSHLDEAVKNGYRDLDALENDPDLSELRKDPKYQDIMAMAKKPAA